VLPKSILFALPILLMTWHSAIAFQDEAKPSTKVVPDELDGQTWAAIESAAKEMEKMQARKEELDWGDWLPLTERVQRAFYLECAKHSPQKVIPAFAKRFGTRGDLEDYFWLAADPDSTLVFVRKGPRSKDLLKGQPREMQLRIAEAQTRLFLEKPELLARYWHGLMWSRAVCERDGRFSRIPFLAGEVNRAWIEEKGDRKANEEIYWWHARYFVILAHATSRDDLLKDADPEKLQIRFAKWFEWYSAHWPMLQPDKTVLRWELPSNPREHILREEPPSIQPPSTPFPKWKGFVPVPNTVDVRRQWVPDPDDP